ncbi:MAG: hypothetical protein NTV04_19835 [Deltaproteobacteria bacterium]|nr:hypothetical protein [Deltaproteobacteria bacterium]
MNRGEEPFTEEDTLWRESIAAFWRREILPCREKWDEEEIWPTEIFRSEFSLFDRIRPKIL